MTTTVAPTATGRVTVLVAKTITVLQRDYLGDQPHAVAALARLRRGAGKEFAQVPDLWGLADTRSLHEAPVGGRPLREEELSRAEDAVHAALTLWALHQQSRRTGMHRSDSRKTPTGLGAAVRRLMPAGDIDEPVRKRLVRAGTAPTLAALAGRLRDIVLLLRREDIELDYALLAEQLYRWQEPGGRDEVRRAWGRSFNAYRHAQDPAAAPAAIDEDSAALADKDAS
ncbi:type I-E CRISPR-associated protein Cse2/CasB [Streptomyces flavidovirens]|uniref:type I-E CRISPR-associated protein Cse2/CasB n=1 Tax=Streptomyces flavidovirens TaxID=67298 RepID=UPI00343486D3